MHLRGNVYFPKTVLPPGSENSHRCVILSNTPKHHGNQVFLMVAIIRSERHKDKSLVHRIPVHSIPLLVKENPSFLKHDSILETHQLFAINEQEFRFIKLLGALSAVKLEEALAGARRLFT